MKYCNLKFGYNKASVKSTAFQTVQVRKNTPWQTKPHQNLMEHKMCLTICIVTKPHLGKVCIFLPILIKGKLIHYIYVSFQFYCVVTTHFTLDSNLNSSIHCSISKSNFQVS